MKSCCSIPMRNLSHHKRRTFWLVILVALLAFCVSGGTLMLTGLTDGMFALEARLGSDIIVVPSSAKSKMNVNEILLNATTGYFYMSNDLYDRISRTEGIESISPQLFLCSLKADCCAAAIQLIGFDPDTDFMIQPWLRNRYDGKPGAYEVVVGCEIGVDVGESIKIYGKNCKVVARLDQTGTGFDTAVYTTNENIRMMMADAQALGIDQKLTQDPDRVVSAVYIRVKNGYTAEQVANDINVHVRKVEAVQTRGVLSGVSDSLGTIADTFRGVMIPVILLCMLILFIAFGMMTGERKSEFALLRMLGYSGRMLMRSIMCEAAMVSAIGACIGTIVGIAIVMLFSNAAAVQLSLPFMVPASDRITLIAILSLIVTLAAGIIASVWSAYRSSRTDTGILMREGH